MENSDTKLKSLQDYFSLRAQINSNCTSATNATASIPLLLIDASIIETMMNHIASTHQLLTRIVKRPTDMWLTHKEALDFFDVSENTLRGYVDRGWLACTIYERQKYFHWADIEKFLMHPDHRKKAFQLGN